VAGNIRQSRWRTTLRRSSSPAPVFAALGDKTRLLLLERLARGGPLSITSLTEHTRVTRQAITKHLHVLASAGLARSSRHGRQQLWELENAALERARQQLASISSQWDRALSRLKAHVERG
jgi:DNA-binding transcriptional ArsR family regulator